MAYDWGKYAPQPWRSVVTPLALPILIQRAKSRRTITYTELGDEIQQRFGEIPTKRKTLYGQPVGAIGYAIEDLGKEWGELIPPINALVVNAASKMPGDGVDQFVEHYLRDKERKSLSKGDRRELMQYVIERVWDYAKWDRVADALGAQLLEVVEDGGEGDLDLPPPQKIFGGESKEHKALKQWVCMHPEVLVEYGVFAAGEAEHYMRSGDSLDAFFENDQTCIAVEVKTSKAAEVELIRGIFQVVKYRAVLKAEQIASGRVPNGKAVLVTTQSLPHKVRQLAKRLMVDSRVLSIEAEQGKA